MSSRFFRSDRGNIRTRVITAFPTTVVVAVVNKVSISTLHGAPSMVHYMSATEHFIVEAAAIASLNNS